MKGLFLSSILFLFCHPLVAQDSVLHIHEFPVHRYEGGAQAFYQAMNMSLKYPREARQAGRIGTSIIALTLAPEGTYAHLEIINPLGKGIDEDVTACFRAVEKNWLAADTKTALRMHFILSYTINSYSFHRVSLDKPFFMDEFIVDAHGGTSSHANSRQQLIERTYKFVEKKKYKKALYFADELIRIDPLYKDWYLLRANINKNLNDNEAVCRDLLKVRDFLDVPVTEALLQDFCE